jgi:hypothetical protein
MAIVIELCTYELIRSREPTRSRCVMVNVGTKFVLKIKELTAFLVASTMLEKLVEYKSETVMFSCRTLWSRMFYLNYLSKFLDPKTKLA